MALSAEDRLAKANIALMGHKETMQYTGLLMCGELQLKEGVPTACTDGYNVWFGREFVESITQPELVGVLLHEARHKMFQHGWLWSGLRRENAQLYNIAADFIVNDEIMELSQQYPQFIALPKGCLYDKKYHGWSTLEVYNDLKKQSENEEGGGGGQGPLDEHDWAEVSPDEVAKRTDEIAQAIRQGALLAGKLGGNKDRMAEFMEAQHDWRTSLEQFMTEVSAGSDYQTWSRPERRWQASGEYMPSSLSESMGALGLGIDTSGSIGGPEVAAFLAHMRLMFNAVTPEALHVVECDATVQSHEIYGPDNITELEAKSSVRGGGGTDMGEVVRYFTNNNIKLEALVILTDGYTPWPEELHCPTLWAITSKGITAPNGVSIYIGD